MKEKSKLFSSLMQSAYSLVSSNVEETEEFRCNDH